jgi:hypothetical protein
MSCPPFRFWGLAAIRARGIRTFTGVGKPPSLWLIKLWCCISAGGCRQSVKPCWFARHYPRHIPVSEDWRGSIQKAKEAGSACRITSVNGLSGHKSALRGILFATNGFGKVVRYDAIEGNQSMTYPLPFLLWCFALYISPLISCYPCFEGSLPSSVLPTLSVEGHEPIHEHPASRHERPGHVSKTPTA